MALSLHVTQPALNRPKAVPESRGIAEAERRWPETVVLATPVWGSEYIRLFCSVVIRNLLAPGNLPALSARLPCTYHIYTDDASEWFCRSSPEFGRLKTLVDVEFHSTTDLVGTNKYGTMTACYNDAIKIAENRKSAIVFLNADMIYSDGSFARVLDLIDDGKRCVEIEGFRVVKKPVEAALRERFNDAIAIRPADLVKLALQNIHPISLSHFWEPESDFGFIPFHTYWRAGDHGLVAKASHIYPLYLHPRSWDELGAARTIDWDLVDHAGLRPDEKYVVCDSEEIFSAELSDAAYVIPPLFRTGCGVQHMRRFVGEHCTEDHRDRLGYTIRFRANPENESNWRFARFKAFCWYKAVCDRSSLYAILLWATSLRRHMLIANFALQRFQMRLGRAHQRGIVNVIKDWLLGQLVLRNYQEKGAIGILGFGCRLRAKYDRFRFLQQVALRKYREAGIPGVLKGVRRQVERVLDVSAR